MNVTLIIDIFQMNGMIDRLFEVERASTITKMETDVAATPDEMNYSTDQTWFHDHTEQQQGRTLQCAFILSVYVHYRCVRTSQTEEFCARYSRRRSTTTKKVSNQQEIVCHCLSDNDVK